MARLKPGALLNVLAVGSGSLLSGATPPPKQLPKPLPKTSASTPATTTVPTGFVGQMARELEARVPGLHVNLTVRGGRSIDAPSLLGMIRSEMAHSHYDLVIWQTGTVEAVRGTPAGEFYQTLADGAAQIAGGSAGLVLVDPQYSRFLAANANVGPYLNAMQTAGALPGVMVFHRFDLMRDWADSGEIDLEHVSHAERPQTSAKLHACLGRELAAALLAEIQLGKP